ncbi:MULTISPECIES: hypothetical protein [Lactococcus]|jgi:hypothetical protein|uniref:Uncharacterized protein n=1 Tax=Lactococcus petauri TaxID=1940789 RepID=A0A252CE25_9LACT|nr:MULTISPECIES: hypothetical protein [Lactococcus]KXT62531.1 hypothetical protein LACDD01_00642 [Lactococcus sp. DD01]OUK04801.1 hypothetical protein BZZ03_03270 [Lactococcus petauri]
MSYDIAVVSFITFLTAMIYLEKGKVPEFLRKGKLFKVIPMLLLFIIMMLTLSVLTHILYFAVVATIMSSCLLLWRFKSYVDQWDKV